MARQRVLRVEGRAVADPDGVVRHVAGTMQDITERRLIERQLAQAQKMEAIGNLTGGMAHDFNNVLGVIIGNLDLLRRLIRDNEAATELCGEALDGASRCTDLIRRLLAFARRQSLRPEITDLNALVGDIARLLGRILGEDIVLSLHLDAGLRQVMADPSQLEAALVNFATNARDAMPKGGRLDITTSNVVLDAGYAALHPEVSPGAYVWSRSATPAAAFRRRSSAASSNRSSPPRNPARAPASGWRWRSASSSSPAATCRSTASLAWARRSGCICRSMRRTNWRAAHPDDASRPRAATRRCWWWRTTRSFARPRCGNWRSWATGVVEAEHAAAALAILSGEGVDLLFTDVVMPGSMDGLDLAYHALSLRPGLKILLTSGFPGVRGGRSTDGELPVPDARQAVAPRRTGADGARGAGPRRRPDEECCATPLRLGRYTPISLQPGRRRGAAVTTRVLVFDDDAAVGRLAVRVATMSGMDAMAVTDATAFAQRLRIEPPQVVLLDLQLGETDGVEQLRLLAERQYGGILVLMSGFDARVLGTARALGQSLGLKVEAVLQKPLRVGELEAVLRRVQTVGQSPSAERLLTAIANDELVLEFQPVVSRKPKLLKKLEALVRWEHPTAGRVSPAEFLPMAESNTDHHRCADRLGGGRRGGGLPGAGRVGRQRASGGEHVHAEPARPDRAGPAGATPAGRRHAGAASVPGDHRERGVQGCLAHHGYFEQGAAEGDAAFDRRFRDGVFVAEGAAADAVLGDQDRPVVRVRRDDVAGFAGDREVDHGPRRQHGDGLRRRGRGDRGDRRPAGDAGVLRHPGVPDCPADAGGGGARLAGDLAAERRGRTGPCPGSGAGVGSGGGEAALAAGDARGAGAPQEPAAAPVRLSPTQIEAMQLLAEGCSVKDIAHRLDIGVGTAKVHLSLAYAALGARNGAEALEHMRGMFEAQAAGKA